MIISPTLALAALALNLVVLAVSTPTPQKLFADMSEILCYDSRYATQEPSLQDCAATINGRIALESSDTIVRTFSRNPTRYQLRLPHTWSTERQQCNITIDIPQLPKQRAGLYARASMLDIKKAAFEVMVACVVRGDHLGGVVQTGKENKLQLRVEAGRRSAIR
ncbi:MAG: hypothetical protein Q9166_004684 [cf. Caloplaca sp. 2 TL-2023]